MKKCIVFDVYGTLLDIASPVARLQDRVGPQADRLADLWRAKQLEYAWVATLTGRYETFWTLTERALSYAFGAIGKSDDKALETDLLEAYKTPDLYAEVPDVLNELRRQGHRLVVFSNANPQMLESALSAVGVLEKVDQVISVDPTRRFKPDQAVYSFASDQIAGWNNDIVFLSSNGWDVIGAATYGWATYWVNRNNAVFEFGEREPSIVVSSLALLPDKLR